MTTTEKVRQVDQLKDERGLNRCLEALELPKSTYYYRKRQPQQSEQEKALMTHIRSIIREHPGYGYRRILPELRERTGERINHKRLRRLLNEHELGLARCLSKKRPSPVRQILGEATGRLNLVEKYIGSGPTPAPLKVFSTDLRAEISAHELHYSEGRRKAYLMTILDVGSCVALGWSVGRSANGRLAHRCLKRVRGRMRHLSEELQGTILHSDQDTVYTIYAWLREVLMKEAMRVSFSERGARGNPWVESLWGRMKTEIGSRIHQACDLRARKSVLTEHFRYYNRSRRHSSIGNVAPLPRLTNILNQHNDEAPAAAVT